MDDPTKEEPVYKGKNLSEWIKRLKGTDHKAREQAIEALSVLGPKAKTAVPALADALNALGSDFSDDNRRMRANTLAAIGEIGEPAVPALVKVLQGADTLNAFDAAKALGHIGSGAKDAIPALIEALSPRMASGFMLPTPLPKLGGPRCRHLKRR